MTNSFLKKLYIFTSFFFLFLVTVLLFFVLTISVKPLKINFLDYFDRKSEIFEKFKINEIGDVLLRFDTTSKNFEVLIENLVYEESYIPNILINIDFNLPFTESFIQPTLKIFDGEVLLKISDSNNQEASKNFKGVTNLKESLNFLNVFKKIEIINTKIRFSVNKLSPHFLIDLEYAKNTVKGHFSKISENENYLVFSIERKKNTVLSNINLKNFSLDFIKLIYTPSLFNYENFKISGNSNLSINNDNQFNEIFFDFVVDGNLTYKTFFGLEEVVFDNTQISGDFLDDKIGLSLDLKHLNSMFSLGTLIDTKKSYSPNVFVKVDKIDVNSLLKIWPNNFKKPIYEWMLNNSSGLIENFYFNLELEREIKGSGLIAKDIKGNFDFSNTEIRYMEEMPKVKSITGEAEIKFGEILFNIRGGVSEKLRLNNGEVKLYDLDTNQERGDVKLEIIGEHLNVTKYLNNSPINKESYAKIKNLEGKTKINLSLLFPLLLDLKSDEIIYRSDVKIASNSLNNVYENISLDKLLLELDIKNTEVNYRGTGNLMNSKIEFRGNQEVENGKYIDSIKGNIFLDAKDINTFYELNIGHIDGQIPISFSYKNFDGNKVKIDAVGELNKLVVESEALGKKLDFKEGKLRFILNPNNNLFNGFVDVKSSDLNFEMNYNYKDGSVMNFEISHFQSPIQDFKVSMKHKDKIKELSIHGNRIVIPKIKFKERNLNEINNLKITLDVNELVLDNSTFLNPLFRLEKKNNFFSFLEVLLINKKDEHKIFLEEINKEMVFSLESNNASSLARIFNYNLNTKLGKLKINGKKQYDDINFMGDITLNDFVLNDGPFITDFLTLFSLKGLLQKLKDGGIFFEDLKGNYIFNNNKLQINDTLIKGSELGIQLDANLDLKTDIFDAKGSIIPAYTINTLITKFPIVGDIITAGSPEEGLIGANFEVETIEQEIKISFNPISVFVPNLIKNFLGD